MPSPRRSYCRLPVMTPDSVPASVSRGTSGLELLLCLQLLPRRSVPGLIFAGEGALAETLRWSRRALRHRLRELETAGLVSVDRHAHLLYVRNSIENDPPSNQNVVKAWARCCADAPVSPVLDEVRGAIDRALTGAKPEIRAEWERQIGTNGSANGSANGLPNGSANGRGTPVPLPDPIPIPNPTPKEKSPALARGLVRVITDPTPDQLQRIVHDVIEEHGELAAEDLAEHVKCIAANRGYRYSGSTVNDAIDATRAARQRRRRA